MNCPSCRAHGSSVSKSIDGAAKVTRSRRCSCGTTWTTVEIVERDSIQRPLVATGGQQAPPMASVSTPLAANGQRGVGGALSSDLSGPLTGSLADPSPKEITRSDPARAKVLSQDFMRFWDLYPKKKSKGAAWRAWQKIKPPLDLVLKALAWQRLSPEWRKESGEFIPFPATYLNATGWEDEPSAGPTARPLRPSGPPVAIAELAAQRAAQLELRARQAQSVEAEKFRRDREADQQKEQNG